LVEDLREEPVLEEKVIYINRVSKVVKGGRRFGFSALVAVGDKANGRVGVYLGKGREVPIAISKGIEGAKKNMIDVPIKGNTIPFELVYRFGGVRILLKPAKEGRGIISGGVERAIFELSGVKDVVVKSFGSQTPVNVAYAIIGGLKEISKIIASYKLRKGIEEE
jgi:small subunit ribosomal protein S5